VFENRVLRRIFGPNRDEVIDGRRNLHNEALLNLWSSASMVRIIKSRSKRRAGHLTGMGKMGFWWERQKKRDL
jgi:hypothetical protein